MNHDAFIDAVSESCRPLNDEEREVLAAHIAQEVKWHLRVRSLKGEAPTLPPPAETDDLAVIVSRPELPTIPEVG